MTTHPVGRPRPRTRLPTAGARGNHLDVVGPTSPTRTLADSMVVDSCQRWLAEALDGDRSSSWVPGRPEATVATGGLIGPPGPAGVPRGWTPPPSLGRHPRFVLMGLGWSVPGARWGRSAARLVRLALSRHYLHAVRDDATRDVLREVGVHNVVVTGCPTSWDVDPAAVRTSPGRHAIVALRHDLDGGRFVADLVELIDQCYDRVFLAQMHTGDRRFAATVPSRWQVVPPQLRALDEVIAGGDLDFVGTAAHAGIRALAAGCRPLIVEGDPHLGSLVGSIGLPTFDRRDRDGLARAMGEEVPLELRRPTARIEEWIGQFLWARGG